MYGTGQRYPYVVGNQTRMLSPQQAAALGLTATSKQAATTQYRKEAAAKAPTVSRGIFVEIEITNSTNQEQKIVLFDALEAYALQTGYIDPAGVSVVGTSKNYQLLLNKL